MTTKPLIRTAAARGVLAAAFLGCGFGVASAHHSFAMFDQQKEVAIDATVKEFQWTNPHIWLEVTVEGQGDYSIEGGSPNNLARRGWKRSSLKPGDKVKVVMNPLKDGTKGGSLVKVSFADGRPVADPV